MKITGDWLYFWDNGDISLITNCYSRDEAMDLLDEVGEAYTSMLVPIKQSSRAIHFPCRESYGEGEMDELTADQLMDTKRPKRKHKGMSSTQLLVQQALKRAGRL
jgi:hypothetical protein